MSVSQILQELPRLTASERQQIRRQLVTLADEQEEIALCDETADAAAAMFDQWESEDHAPTAK